MAVEVRGAEPWIHTGATDHTPLITRYVGNQCWELNYGQFYVFTAAPSRLDLKHPMSPKELREVSPRERSKKLETYTLKDPELTAKNVIAHISFALSSTSLLHSTQLLLCTPPR